MSIGINPANHPPIQAIRLLIAHFEDNVNVDEEGSEVWIAYEHIRDWLIDIEFINHK